jgi:hypothetical protein
MKTISKITLAIGILCLFAFAQTEKPKAAVYIKGNPEGRDALRMAVNTFLIKSQKYQMIAVDAIDVVAKEQNRQRGGSVSNEDIALLGRDAGAQYVCVVERSESDGISYVSTSMVSVQSKIAELSEMSELPRGERIIDLIERQINTMLGIYTPPEPEPEPEYTPPAKAEYTPPVEQSYSENSYTEHQDEDYKTPTRDKAFIRLGARWRGGFFKQDDDMAGSELFDKSYVNYEEMDKSVGHTKNDIYGWYLNPGLTLDVWLGDMIALATELNYNLIYGYDIWYKPSGDEYFAHASISYQTIEVPILLRLVFKEFGSYFSTDRRGSYFESGFQFGFPISSKATVSSGSKFPDTPFEYEYSDFRVKTDHALVFGVGIRTDNFSIGLRITFPLTKLDKYGTINSPVIINLLTLAYDFL